MLKIKTRCLLAGIALLSVPCASALAAGVSLTLSDTVTVGATNSVNVLPGQTFQMTLKLVPTANEQTTGLDYNLEALGAGSGWFSIIGRNLSGSPYSDPFKTDAQVSTSPANLLDPANDLDLGAIVADPTVPTSGNGPFTVAIYTIQVDAATPYGTYVIQSDSPPAQGWTSTQANNFAPTPFTSQAFYNVVVPEPSVLTILGVGMAAAGLKRRRR